jgi:hypothetical protein
LCGTLALVFTLIHYLGAVDVFFLQQEISEQNKKQQAEPKAQEDADRGMKESTSPGAEAGAFLDEFAKYTSIEQRLFR